MAMTPEDWMAQARMEREAAQRRRYAQSWRGRLHRRWAKSAHFVWKGWLVATPDVSQPGDMLAQMRVRVHVRKWHPGWWLFIGRAYWHALRGTRLSLYIRGRRVLPHG